MLTATPLQPAAGDDDVRKLLKDRYNAALAALQAQYHRALVDPTLPVGTVHVGMAARTLLDADLALASPNDTLPVYERYLELTKYLDQLAEGLLKSKVISRGDFEAAHERRLDAESKLRDQRRTSAGKSSEGGAGRTSLPGGPQPTGREVAANAAERLPAMLTAKPLEPAAGDHELVKLFKERYNAALKSLRGQYERAQIDAAMPMVTITLAAAGRTLLDAELALSSGKDNVPLYERYLELTKFFEYRAAGLLKAKFVGPADFDAAREARLDAEIKLMQAKYMTSPRPRRTGANVQLLEVRVRIAEGEVNAARAVVDQTEAELKRVLTNLKYRQTQLDRVQSARKQDAGSISDSGLEEAIRARDEAAAGVEAAKAAIRAAQAQVEIKGAQLEQVHLELKQAASEGK
jgi:hypothetical protein